MPTKPIMPPAPSGADVKARMSKMSLMKQQLAAEPKVKIRCQKDEVVIKNGYPFEIKGKTYVMVPESIALILEESERI